MRLSLYRTQRCSVNRRSLRCHKHWGCPGHKHLRCPENGVKPRDGERRAAGMAGGAGGKWSPGDHPPVELGAGGRFWELARATCGGCGGRWKSTAWRRCWISARAPAAAAHQGRHHRCYAGPSAMSMRTFRCGTFTSGSPKSTRSRSPTTGCGGCCRKPGWRRRNRHGASIGAGGSAARWSECWCIWTPRPTNGSRDRRRRTFVLDLSGFGCQPRIREPRSPGSEPGVLPIGRDGNIPAFPSILRKRGEPTVRRRHHTQASSPACALKLCGLQPIAGLPVDFPSNPRIYIVEGKRLGQTRHFPSY